MKIPQAQLDLLDEACDAARRNVKFSKSEGNVRIFTRPGSSAMQGGGSLVHVHLTSVTAMTLLAWRKACRSRAWAELLSSSRPGRTMGLAFEPK